MPRAIANLHFRAIYIGFNRKILIGAKNHRRAAFAFRRKTIRREQLLETENAEVPFEKPNVAFGDWNLRFLNGIHPFKVPFQQAKRRCNRIVCNALCKSNAAESTGKTIPAAAAFFGVGIVEHESRALQRILIIHFRAVQILKTFCVAHDSDAVL